MNDGNWRTPIPLPAHAPITQTPGDFLVPQAFFCQGVSDCVDSLLITHSAKAVGVDGDAARLVAIPFVPLVVVVLLAVHEYYFNHRDVVLARKYEIAFVVRRHAHDGAITVADEHVVTDPKFNLVPVQRMGHKQTGPHAFFLPHRQLGLRCAASLAGFNECRQCRVRPCRVACQRMLRCYGTKRYAHDRIGACCKHIHPAVANQFATAIPDVVRESETHTFGAADPVFLHQLDAFGPARQFGLRMVEQFLRVVGYLEVVTWDLALFYDRSRAPALAVDDLFVSEHGHIDRIPVHDLRLAICNALFQHL